MWCSSCTQTAGQEELQGLNQDLDMWGHEGEEAMLGGSLDNMSTAFEWFV